MRLSVFGLGYVGTVSAASLAARGHSVIGVDSNAAKVELVAGGKSPIVERDIGELVASTVSGGRLRATMHAARAVEESDVSFVCVGTPGLRNGNLDIRALAGVSREIGEAIAAKPARHSIVIRSTMLPGTFRNIVLPQLEKASGKKAGRDFGLAVNPEFLREGCAVADFRNPEKTVIGADDETVADAVAAIYEDLPGAVVRTSPELAEIAKYLDNSWHALKIGFANEVGNLCKSVGVDGREAMDIFALDRKLNLSDAYLKPGFAFGGSCLPKDARALSFLARTHDLDLPILNAILPSNAIQIERAVEWVLSYRRRRIALLGCAFKPGTDDMRESPFIILAERLIGKGCALRIFDENVHLSMLLGANRDYVMATIPHLAALMATSGAQAVADAELVLLGASAPAYLAIAQQLRPDQILLDFAHDSGPRNGRHDGVNW